MSVHNLQLQVFLHDPKDVNKLMRISSSDSVRQVPNSLSLYYFYDIIPDCKNAENPKEETRTIVFQRLEVFFALTNSWLQHLSHLYFCVVEAPRETHVRLLACLETATCLTSLMLGDHNIDDSDAVPIARFLAHHKGLICLRLMRNKLTHACLPVFVNAIKCNPTLQFLSLGFLHIWGSLGLVETVLPLFSRIGRPVNNHWYNGDGTQEYRPARLPNSLTVYYDNAGGLLPMDLALPHTFDNIERCFYKGKSHEQRCRYNLLKAMRKTHSLQDIHTVQLKGCAQRNYFQMTTPRRWSTLVEHLKQLPNLRRLSLLDMALANTLELGDTSAPVLRSTKRKK